MITIKTETVKDCGDYDKMCTTLQMEGEGVVIKEEIKTLLQHCKKDERLRTIIIMAIREVLYDN